YSRGPPGRSLRSPAPARDSRFCYSMRGPDLEKCMPRFFYSLIFLLCLPLILLRLLYRAWRAPAYARRWAERFALGGDLRAGGIWVHAVSVGESIAAAPMVRELLARHPELPVTMTCMTPTGSEQIRKLFGDRVGHAYLPYDPPWLQRRLIRRLAPRVAIIMEIALWPNLVAESRRAGVHVVLAIARSYERPARGIRRRAPRVAIIMETELWPNLVAECRRAGVPVVLANARLSERSARGYRRVLPLVRPMFAALDWVAVQSAAEAQRFAALGVRDTA